MFSPEYLEDGGDGRHPRTLYQQQLVVLAGMVRNSGTALGPAMAELTEEDFTMEHTKKLFSIVRRLYLRGDPVSPMSVCTEAGREDAGWILSILEENYIADDLTYYVGKLRESSALNRLNRAGYALAYCEDPEEARGLLAKVNEAAARQGAHITSLGDAARAYVDSIGRTPPTFIRMGLRIFDEEILLRRGRFFVIGGYPSSGKTLLTLQMAQHVGQRYRVGYFSFETDDWDIAVRTLSARSGVYNKKVQQQNLNAADRAAICQAAEELRQLQVDLIQANGMTADDIRAVTLSRKYDVIFVDYLQNVDGSNPRATTYEKVSGVSRALQGLSRTGNVLVVALSQLSRPEPRKDGRLVPPNMSSLRESGQIEQDADVIALLYPEDMDDNSSNRVLKVAKNKDGEKLALDLSFTGGLQRLEVLGRRRRESPDPKRQVPARDGSGFMLSPEGRGPQAPEELQQKMAF